jgi:hypothetical protein
MLLHAPALTLSWAAGASREPGKSAAGAALDWSAQAARAQSEP